MELLPITIKLRAAIIALLILPAAFALSMNLQARAAELTGSSTNCNNNGVRPSPYAGGAGVSRVFYPADGSTVTVTTTGAVIKQSPCQTPYREGWVNTADLSCVNSEADLSVRLRPGSSNPYHNFASSCPAAVSSSNATTTSSTSSTRPAVATTTAANTVKAASLPNTGPGDILALGGISSVIGTAGHFVYARRRRV